MEQGIPGNVTPLLQGLDGGDREALGKLLPLVYIELRAIAGQFFNGSGLTTRFNPRLWFTRPTSA